LAKKVIYIDTYDGKFAVIENIDNKDKILKVFDSLAEAKKYKESL
jgi:hypothetical protein